MSDLADWTHGWTPVDIRHRRPMQLMSPVNFGHKLVIDDEDVTQWLDEQGISEWAYTFNVHTLQKQPILLFKNPRDAVMFALRWS